MTTKIETYLPVFAGFYGTIFEADNEEQEINDINEEREAKGLEAIGYDDCEWNYKEYHQSASEQCTTAIEDELKHVLGSGVTVTFQKLVSPREYNFANDSINVEISLNKSAQEAIIQILTTYADEFKKFIKERYSSCDGFISSHSNDSSDWMTYVKRWDKDELSHKLGAILGFILEEVEEYTQEDLYDAIESHTIGVDNYCELIGE